MARQRDKTPKQRASPTKGRTAEEQFAAAQRKIQRAGARAAKDLDLSGRSKLTELPPEIAALTTLQRLNFSHTAISNLRPVAGLTALQQIVLNHTAVGDLSPLAGHTSLRELYVGDTGVSDLRVLASLTALRKLGLRGTRVTDLAPLAGLTALQWLSLDATQVADLAPLAGLTALQELWLDDTRVADLAALAGLTALQTLWLNHTAVTDLAPLIGLAALQSLWLNHTAVTDLAPLAGLAALQTLWLDGTQVADLAPLAGLVALQDLRLDGTQVADLAPLAGLTALETLALARTQIASLAPIAGLAALQSLHLNGTRVSDLAPLAGLTALETLSLDDTRVSDLAPIARATRLQDVVASRNALTRRRGRGLSYGGTPVSKTSPFDRFVRLREPARTVETINEVRRRLGLPEHIPEGYERPADIAALLRGSPPEDTADPSDAETAAALEQRPATFSFPYANGRFRARAQISAPADLPLAADIYAELKAKALEAKIRLTRSNAPKRVKDTIDRLIVDLGASVEDVAPGKLLMRSRSLDADVAAYDTPEARREIAEDALAQVIDVATSVADLKGCYPALTRLEAARVAQDLLTKDVGATLEQMSEIRDVAAAAEIVDPSAVEALKVGEPEIEHANDIIADKEVADAVRVVATEKRAEIAAQMLLDHRNFVASVLKTAAGLLEKTKGPSAAVAKGLAGVASKTLKQFEKKAPEPLSDAMVATAVGALAGLVLGPTVGLAAFLATYKPLAKKGAQLAKAATNLAKRVGTSRSKAHHHRETITDDEAESA
jgi:Leucine-rich repeat (LRR) protein